VDVVVDSVWQRFRVCWLVVGDVGVCGQKDKGMEVFFSPEIYLNVEYHML
jgi:hypothetical protein